MLHVNAETRAMRDFFATLRNAGVHTIDPLDAHITLIDSAETQVTVFSDRDQLTLDNARAEAGKYLATLPYCEMVLAPADAQLHVYGRRLGVLIADQQFLLGVREYVGGIFKAEANIEVSNRDYEGHMTVGLKTRGPSAAAKKFKSSRIPRNIHIDGHDVGERVYIEDPSRQRSRQSYTNKRHRSVS